MDSFYRFARDELLSNEMADILLPLCTKEVHKTTGGEIAWDINAADTQVYKTHIMTPGSRKFTRFGNSFRELFYRFGVLFLVTGERDGNLLNCNLYVFREKDSFARILESSTRSVTACAFLYREERQHRDDGAFSSAERIEVFDNYKQSTISLIVDCARKTPPRISLARFVKNMATAEITDRETYMTDDEFLQFIGRCTSGSNLQEKRRRGAEAFMKQLRGR